MLNYLWFAFFLVAFLQGCFAWLIDGNLAVMGAMVKASFDSARTAFEIAMGLVGILCLWLGLLKIAEKAGIIDFLARLLAPLFARLMPEVPRGHPALGSIVMNMAANILGLDNAATPVGLRAMEQLQSLNPSKDTASNAQILFLVINTASITLLPVTIFMYRAQLGASDPTAIFVPLLLATAVGTLTGFLSVAWMQRINLLDRVLLLYIGGIVGILVALIGLIMMFPREEQASISSFIGNFTIFFIIMAFLTAGLHRRVPIYETFVEGAKEGFEVALKILPHLVAMLVAISVLRASGVLDLLLNCISMIVGGLGINTDFVPALPTGLLKPFSGSGARGMMLETMKHYGADSFPATIAALFQGSSETTFYVLAVYFGSVGITRYRHALGCALLADLASTIAAIAVGYWFFH